MRPSIAAALAAALFLSTPGLAGQVVVADGHPIEFTASEKEVVFAVKGEDGKPFDTAGVAAKAYVQAEGKTQTLTLKAVPPNTFVGTLAAPLPAGAKVVFSTKAHGHNVQARFENKR